MDVDSYRERDGVSYDLYTEKSLRFLLRVSLGTVIFSMTMDFEWRSSNESCVSAIFEGNERDETFVSRCGRCLKSGGLGKKISAKERKPPVFREKNSSGFLKRFKRESAEEEKKIV